MPHDDLLQAENSDRYRDVQQHIDYLSSYIGQIEDYVPYLQQENIDLSHLARISEAVNVIKSSLEAISNDVRNEEAHLITASDLDSAELQAHEIAQYQSALSVYEAGDWKTARAKFNVLAKTARGLVKANAVQCVSMIDSHDWVA
jgi:TolA-binding protein